MHKISPRYAALHDESSFTSEMGASAKINTVRSKWSHFPNNYMVLRHDLLFYEREKYGTYFVGTSFNWRLSRDFRNTFLTADLELDA